ncbi:A/G-specific adenine glycosylase [Nocardioides sp.]|jgi:A/G-specific adenine glycosylase|uniref:A/G-specific adenine glycosylase n=1 Tax=Nocardioides sp. TaxID=35761 RepID=UPI00262196AC|nr:A/G-specific adenine glycosylase [Nocardioides sp.]
MSPLHDAILHWYDAHQRDLPWRRPDASPWSVMVSEFMLQQTPVVRVLPVWQTWMERWPEPADLAAEPVGEAVRAWGRLGYPRRAQRLHAAATAIVEQYDGDVPATYEELLGLPGIGDYTASAIASFAFGARHVVLDTNVRRVFARVISGTEFPPTSITRAERDLATDLLPGPDTAPVWGVAVMELGALICTASSPSCADCPVRTQCAWVEAGRPAYDGPARKAQAWAGTDRQCRGRIMAVLRDADGPVHRTSIEATWDKVEQRERALAGLLADGLVTQVGPDTFTL